MALHYNLAKVYEISDNDREFVLQITQLFATEVPEDLIQLKEGIDIKNYHCAAAYAHKIKPTLNLLGMSVALEEIIIVENWAKNKGKRKEIIETFKSLEDRIFKAIKEINKDLLQNLTLKG